jgi:hypothetical protein
MLKCNYAMIQSHGIIFLKNPGREILNPIIVS